MTPSRLARLKGSSSKLWPAVDTLAERTLEVGRARVRDLRLSISLKGDGEFDAAFRGVVGQLPIEQQHRLADAIDGVLRGGPRDEQGVSVYMLAADLAGRNIQKGADYRLPPALADLMLSRADDAPTLEMKPCEACGLLVPYQPAAPRRWVRDQQGQREVCDREAVYYFDLCPLCGVAQEEVQRPMAPPQQSAASAMLDEVVTRLERKGLAG